MATVTIQARGCEVDEELEAHFHEKIEHLEHHWSGDVEVHVRMWQHRGRCVSEITLVSGGLIMRGEERAQTARQAFDTAIGKIDEQVRRFKEKMLTRSRRHDNRDDVAGTVNRSSLAAAGIAADGISQTASTASTQLAEEDEEDEGVVRVKRFALKPMSAEEASLQMELLGHSFFVFRDAKSDQVSVVYRRRSGGFGLIEPVSD